MRSAQWWNTKWRRECYQPSKTPSQWYHFSSTAPQRFIDSPLHTHSARACLSERCLQLHIYLLVHLLVHLLFHLFIHLFSHPFIHLFIHHYFFLSLCLSACHFLLSVLSLFIIYSLISSYCFNCYEFEHHLPIHSIFKRVSHRRHKMVFYSHFHLHFTKYPTSLSMQLCCCYPCDQDGLFVQLVVKSPEHVVHHSLSSHCGSFTALKYLF